jgi:AraC-like DNA-binding protein
MRVHLSTDDLAPRDREPFWLDFVAKHVIKVTLRGRPDPTTFWAKLDAEVVGRFTLFEFQTSHCGGGRTNADVSKDDSDRFYLRRVPREESYAAAPTRTIAAELRLGPGDFCITSSEWPHKCEMKASTSISGLLIPREALSPLLIGGQLTRPVLVPSGSPLGSLLSAAFDAASTQLPALSPELGESVLQNLCGLVALACGASDEGRSSAHDSLRTARLEAARRHIDQHLAEPELTPANTAAALGISLRHLHLLFEPTGISFAQYVMQRRLLQCRAALTSPTGASRSVADIAFGWGFNSLATFYRAFEREFGLTPTTLRAAHGD